MGKRNKNIDKKIKKLERKFYQNNKYVSREEFLIPKLSKSLRMYYDKISNERKKALISYILDQEDYVSETSLDSISISDDKPIYKMHSCRKISEVIVELRKSRKKQKKATKMKHVLKGSKGLLYLLNPEAYDQTLLSKKDYRKQLKKLAKEESKVMPIELDCTLKNFHLELMKNESVNEDVMQGFWNKYGY